MENKTYIVATIKPWNIKMFEDVIGYYPGSWRLITKKEELTIELINELKPRYIFFPHWSWIVPAEILKGAECVCFHETDLPKGRGGSPIQNLISRGYTETMVTALRMTEELDAGPIYMKERLSLEGLAEEIFIRTSKIVAEMILKIAQTEPVPEEQKGEPTFFKRRTPEQSEISPEVKNLKEAFDHIRMIDAEGYPEAYINYGNLKIELSRPSLKADNIKADVKITFKKNDENRKSE